MTRVPRASDIPTRMALVERSVMSLEGQLSAQRDENRRAFEQLDRNSEDLKQTITQLIQNGAGSKPDYYRMASAAAIAVGIIAAVFSLAEWRVTTAVTPLTMELTESRRAVDTMRREHVDLQVKIGVEKELRERLERAASLR